MQPIGLFRRRRPGIKPRRSAPQESTEATSFGALFGFSVIGLLLACILTLLPMDSGFAGTKLLLSLLAAPVAALLGFTLGHSD